MFEKWLTTLNLLFTQLNPSESFKEIISLTLQRRKKKLKIALLFSWIVFVIIVISLDLTEKVLNWRYLFIFKHKWDISWFKK